MSFSDGASGDTLYFKWTSRSGTPPVPTTLAGSPVISIYKDASLTQSTAGVTLTADFDSVTGLNHVSIDTTADATFYANGHKYYLVITTGTVGGTSVVGEVVGEFMLGAAALTAAQIATGVWQDATGGDFTVSSSIGKSLYTSGVAPGASGGLFIAGTNAATTITTSLTTHLVGTVDTVTTVTNQLTAAQVATGIWQDATAGDFTAASSIGKSLYTSGNAPGAAGGIFIAGTNAATTITTALTTTFTGNLTGSVGSVTGSVGSVTGAVGSVAGNVGGNVVGSVASVTGNVGGNVSGNVVGSTASVTGNVGGNVTGTIGGFTATALAEFFTLDTTKVYADAVSGSIVKEVASNATATVSGTVDANVTSINSVSTSAVTTVDANIGTTQPINFTGTGASAWVKADIETILGTTSAGTPGYIGPDWGVLANKTTVNALTNTTFSPSQIVASVSGAVGSVSGNIGGNVAGNVTGTVGGLTTAALAQFVTTDTTKTAGDIAAGSVVYLSRHSIAGLGF